MRQCGRPDMPRSKKDRSTKNRSIKMLASTVQFSNNDQASSDHAHHQTHSPLRRYDRHRSPEPRTPAPTPHRGGPFPQDPTACLRPGHPTHTHAPHPFTGAVLAGADTAPAELVSVPPSSSTTDTRTHPQPGRASRPARGSGPPIPHQEVIGRPVLLRKEVI